MSGVASNTTPTHDYGEYRKERKAVTKATHRTDHHPGNDAFWGACWAATDTVENLIHE